MPRLPQSADDLRARLAEVSGWQTATRDDRQVAETLHETRSVDRIHALNETAFFDELFHYIREIGAWPLLEGLEPDHREGALYPFLQFVLFTIMRCVGGVQSMLATRDLLLAESRKQQDPTLGPGQAQGGLRPPAFISAKVPSGGTSRPPMPPTPYRFAGP